MAEAPEPAGGEAPGSELIKVTAGLNIDLAVAELLTRVVGAPLEQAVGLLTDVLGLFRFELALKLLKRAQRKLAEADFDQKKLGPIDPSSFLPILEFGSTTMNQSMQERWATLLANAIANPDDVPPSFAETLRQLAPREAALLEALVDAAVADDGAFGEWRTRNLPAAEIAERVGLTGDAYDVAINNLVRLRLCIPRLPDYPGDAILEDLATVTLTGLGYEFVRACRPAATR